MLPLLAGVSPDEMRGPQRVLNALECGNESQLFQLIDNVGEQLGIKPQSSASYLDKVRTVKLVGGFNEEFVADGDLG